MAGYTASATCQGDKWVIDVPRAGTTEADSVDDHGERALDLVIARTHTAPEKLHVRVRIV